MTLRVGRLNLSRVVQRHVQGGHDVRPDLILDCRRRSHERFTWFAQQAASVLVYDNSGFGLPSYVAGKTGVGWDIGNVSLLPPELAAAILALVAAPNP